jgi:hypothetical protein
MKITIIGCGLIRGSIGWHSNVTAKPRCMPVCRSPAVGKQVVDQTGSMEDFAICPRLLFYWRCRCNRFGHHVPAETLPARHLPLSRTLGGMKKL